MCIKPMQRPSDAQLQSEEGGRACGGAGAFSCGEELHSRVPPESWCVSRRDLRQLRAQVLVAIRNGQITPTLKDKFDPADTKCGPSIYTVVEQYIKPVTEASGGMSWALMMHPEGLKCQVFVTHAWQEGIFEFVDKVLCSLPWGTSSVWCCFLANPQNLDIGKMIQTPAESPFAKALLAAPTVLVVPNEKGSIYTRLWCVYEAFLAYEADKVIRTARPPISAELLCEVPAVLSCFAVGWSISLLRNEAMFMMLYTWCCALQFPLMFASVASARPRVRHAINLIGLTLSATIISIVWYACTQGEYQVLNISDEDARKFRWRCDGLHEAITLVCFFLFAEFDRVRHVIAQREAFQLEFGYTGSVRDSNCHCAKDEMNLRLEIGHRIKEVDETISVLIVAGMSTSSLRLANKLGVRLEGAGFIEYAFLVLMLSKSFFGWWKLDQRIADVWMSDMEEVICLTLNILNKIFAIFFCLHLALQPADARVFSIRVLHKVGIAVALVPVTVVEALRAQHLIANKHAFVTVCVAMVTIWLFVVPVSVARIYNVAKVPRLGRRLASMVAVPSLSQPRRTRVGTGDRLVDGLP